MKTISDSFVAKAGSAVCDFCDEDKPCAIVDNGNEDFFIICADCAKEIVFELENDKTVS